MTEGENKVKFDGNIMMQAAQNLEYINKRLGVYIEELKKIVSKFEYIDGEYDRVQQLNKNIENATAQRYNIRSITTAIYEVINYYKKCEMDNESECLEERIMFREAPSGIIDLASITKILNEI